MQGPDDQGPGSELDRLRISDADRHRVAEVLREAAGDGRIDLTELDERLEATYAARTYADLVPITIDLPTHADQVRPPAGRPSVVVPSGAPTEERHVAILSGVDRRGRWTVPASLAVTCLVGGANLDLRQATFAAQEVVITVNAVVGGAEIVVNPRTRVVVEGTGIMGGFSGPSDDDADLDASSPTVRVRGFAIIGGVSVTRKQMPD